MSAYLPLMARSKYLCSSSLSMSSSLFEPYASSFVVLSPTIVSKVIFSKLIFVTITDNYYHSHDFVILCKLLCVLIILLMNFSSDIWSLGCVLYELLTLKHAVSVLSMQLAPVVPRVENTLHWINHSPWTGYLNRFLLALIQWIVICPLDDIISNL